MKNLMNTISNGLCNALVIDDNDSSVSYSHTSIDMSCSMIDLTDLYDIFLKRKSNIFNADTTNCVTLITIDNEEIPLNKYKKQTVKFLKISTPEMRCHQSDILIATDCNHFITKHLYKWSNGKEIFRDDIITMPSGLSYDEAINDFNGYLNCEIIMDIAKQQNKIKDIEAITVACGQEMRLSNTMYQGYLPSCGQFYLISQYIEMINYIFKYLGFTIIPILTKTKNYWHTSTEADRYNEWCIYRGMPNKSGKPYLMNVLTLFHCLNK